MKSVSLFALLFAVCGVVSANEVTEAVVATPEMAVVVEEVKEVAEEAAAVVEAAVEAVEAEIAEEEQAA